MDSLEVEESFFAASDAKLHGGMCKTFSTIHCKILTVFPELEAARPRSKSGIQALCSLHLALDKAKSILQHCSQCSKLYLAITGDSVLLKFEKARSALVDSLRRVEDIVPQSIGSQINEIVDELEATELLLDPSEKQIGDDIIALLQEGTSFSNCSDTNELESFYQAATKLGISSSRGALIERRALKKLIDRARAEEDKRKESIVAYLLHLMRKYSKLFRTEFSEDTDSQGSAPCSPTVQSSFENGRAFDRQFSKLSSFNFRPAMRRSGQVPTAPEELRCPISLQLMFDPVVIASGQTYERLCIEKWFGDGHGTCPKTQQMLPHLFLTPNYCVKGLVSSWCEHNGVLPPVGPPDSLDFNYWRLALSESEAKNSRLVESVGSCQLKDVNVVALEESGTIQEEESNYEMRDVLERHEEYLDVLTGYDDDLVRKCEVVEQIRVLLKDDEEARTFMGANGFVEALLRFLEAGLRQGNLMAQEVGAMALFNLVVDNNRNKELMLAAQVIPLLEDMISNQTSKPSAIALYLNLSFLEEAKPIIGSSQAVPFLSDTLTDDSSSQCKLDALQTLYNLSTHKPSIQTLLSSDLVPALQSFLANSADPTWTEKSIAVLLNLASTPSGKEEMASNADLIGTLATVLDTGGPTEQEHAVVCLFVLCNGNDKCIQMVLQEGVIPALVSVSVNGSVRGKEKAQKLLLLFREQRQKEHSSQHQAEKEEASLDRTGSQTMSVADHESKPFSKAVSKRKIMKGWSFLRRHKSGTVS